MTSSANDARADAAAALAARGDGDAFELLCRLLQDDVWRYCSSIVGDPDLAADAAQDTFVRAVTAIRKFRGECPVRLYLLVLARRSCADVLRRDGRHRSVPLPDHLDATTPAPGGAIETGMLLQTLAADLRQAFVLTQLLGLAYQEAAGVAGCPIGTIRSRVFRARAQLVAALHATDAEEDRDAR